MFIRARIWRGVRRASPLATWLIAGGARAPPSWPSSERPFPCMGVVGIGRFSACSAGDMLSSRPVVGDAACGPCVTASSGRLAAAEETSLIDMWRVHSSACTGPWPSTRCWPRTRARRGFLHTSGRQLAPASGVSAKNDYRRCVGFRQVTQFRTFCPRSVVMGLPRICPTAIESTAIFVGKYWAWTTHPVRFEARKSPPSH